jgi:hypothetical protein
MKISEVARRVSERYLSSSDHWLGLLALRTWALLLLGAGYIPSAQRSFPDLLAEEANELEVPEADLARFLDNFALKQEFWSGLDQRAREHCYPS